jgi:hypothetical protein
MTPAAGNEETARMSRRVIRELACGTATAILALYVSLPLWIAKPPVAHGYEFFSHLRHIYEYGLAVREPQIIPLVAPTLNDAVRVPLFQYYSGTGYTLPGLMTAAGLRPYTALIATVILQSFLGALAVGLLCRELGLGAFASFAASVAFQLFPFGGVDLYNRGGYVEWVSLVTLPLVLYLSLRLARRRPALATAGNMFLLSVAWAYFVPIHPVQSLYAGGLVAGLAFWHCYWTSRDWGLVRNLFVSYLLGTLLCAWFWLPVVLDYGHVKMIGHLTFENRFFTWPALLWPWYRATPGEEGWAIQVGLHFALAAVVTLLARPSLRDVRWLAAVFFVLCLLIAVELQPVAVVQRLFRPLQWNYRLLIPCALLGAICLGRAFGLLDGLQRFRTAANVCRAVLLLAIVGTSSLYFLPSYLGIHHRPSPEAVRYALSPDFKPFNSSLYSQFGTDYRSLGWWADGRLAVNEEHPLAREGVPFEFTMALESDRDLGGLRVLVGKEPALSTLERALGTWRLRGLVVPPQGRMAADRDVRFDLPGEGGQVRIRDCAFRAVGEGQDWFRLPGSVRPLRRGYLARYQVTVPSGQPGLYQVPVNFLPTMGLRVNGLEVRQSSLDANMVIVPLLGGVNAVEVTTLPHPVALGLMAAVAVFWLGLFGWLAIASLCRRLGWGAGSDQLVESRPPSLPAAA